MISGNETLDELRNICSNCGSPHCEGCSVNDSIQKLKNVTEETSTGDIAKPMTTVLGRPLFHVSNDLFYKIGFTNRSQHGWYKNFYGTAVGEWAKNNKGKKFTIKHEDMDLYIDCEVK